MSNDESKLKFGVKKSVEEERSELLELANDLPRLCDVTDVTLLRAAMRIRFEKAVGSERWLRMTATPAELQTDRVNVGDDNLRMFVQFPYFGQRRDGWYLGMAEGDRQISLSPLGFESRPTELPNRQVYPPSVLLTRSGHFEFAVPLFHWICFRQNRAEFEAQPWLWPTAIVEFPYNFLIFVRELFKRIGVSGAFIASTEYLNFKGCMLQAGRPDGMPFLDGPFGFQGKQYGPYQQRLEQAFDLDQTALAFALDLYRKFGFDRKHVPFFDNGKFQLKGP